MLALACCLGLFGGVGHWLIILAHARAPAPALAPYAYFQLLPMALCGWAVFGTVPTQWTAVGAVIILAAGLALMRWERRAAALVLR